MGRGGRATLARRPAAYDRGVTSGDGWTTCAAGHRHWGRFGAAGLLLRAEPDVRSAVALQLRAEWTHNGGTWGVLGGARDGCESAVQAALREAGEEATVASAQVRVEASYVDDHGGWSYTTVVGSAVGPMTLEPRSGESDAVRWVPLDQVDGLDLHPGFGRTWPLLRGVGPAPVLVVDGANVVGSRPDGWWKDRVGAAERLRDQLARVVVDGVEGIDPSTPPGLRSFPSVVLIVEGRARHVGAVDGVEVVGAPGSGDDAVVAAVTERTGAGRPLLVATSDRELRDRVMTLGAGVLGVRTLLDLL